MTELLIEPILAMAYLTGALFMASMVTLAKVFKYATKVEKFWRENESKF